MSAELHTLWLEFDRELGAGALTHLDYDAATQTLTCRPPAGRVRWRAGILLRQLVPCDVADVLRFVKRECGFLAALKPQQPRYARKVADEDSCSP